MCKMKCGCVYKTCKECKSRRPTDWFAKSENSDDGFSPFCLKCMRRFRREAEIRYDNYFKFA